MTATATIRRNDALKKTPMQPRRGVYYEARSKAVHGAPFFDDLDAAYRALCAILFNFVPKSGHPGGSVSSSRIIQGLLFERMDYDFSDPDAPQADHLCYTAGHKALGLYAMWALRNELVRLARPKLLPHVKRQLRFEDLLGFRRNPTQETPLFKKFKSKALDGHPTPATPFVPFATGASGVGVTVGVGYALGARDAYGVKAPRIHLLEGEGGMTPGRVHEAIAAAATVGLDNLMLHIDWNQSSIDSDQVCPWDGKPGDYVQWTPMELMHLHDWNVVYAADGHDLGRVFEAQRLAESIKNGQPTAVVYRTVKGWRYGIEGRKSHGAGHGYCSPEFYRAVEDFEKRFDAQLPHFSAESGAVENERAFFETLTAFRRVIAARPGFAKAAAERVAASQKRLRGLKRKPRQGAPELKRLYKKGLLNPAKAPKELTLVPGKNATLRDALGAALGYLNRSTRGAFIGCSADLTGSTSLSKMGEGFKGGFYHVRNNPDARITAVGGICEDAMGGAMAGASTFGSHVGVTSSYAAFITPLQHITARLHGIGQGARHMATKEARNTWIMINAHAGAMTGEDGPTHADPQPLQLLQNNFPQGSLITLTPWEPQELWPLIAAGLAKRPAALCPFVPRPPVQVPDRRRMGMPPAAAAAQGVYAIRRAKTPATVVLQGCGAATVFVYEVLPVLEREGIKLNVFYVASAELFGMLPKARREKIFPSALFDSAMGITDFTLPTMQRWVRSEAGAEHTMHSFQKGEFLSSGDWKKVFEEGGMDAPAQLKVVRAWVKRFAKKG
ncbi:MAG: hypothetical protein ABIJ96_15700 [Elusimicrobiota bacterium]